MMKRIARLFPLLITTYIFYFIVANTINFVSAPAQSGWVLPSLMEIAATITMTFGLGLPNIVVYNFASWSISVEFYTYIIFALLCVVTSKKYRLPAFILFSSVAAFALVRVDLITHQCATSDKACLDVVASPGGFARCIFGFFAGCVAYAVASKHPLVESLAKPLYSIPIALLAVVTLAASTIFGQLAYLAPVLFALLVLAVCRDLGPISKILSAKVPQILGRLSYSMYLLHMPLLLFFEPLMHSSSSSAVVLWLGIFLATLLALSEITYRFIEVPGRATLVKLARQMSNGNLVKQYLKY